MKNRLLTMALLVALANYPLYSQDSKKKDAICVAHFYLGSAHWYITEGQQEGEDFTFFGIVTGLAETEYGYISAHELASVSVDTAAYGYNLGTLQVQQDLNFKPCPLSEIEDEELQSFLSKLYDK